MHSVKGNKLFSEDTSFNTTRRRHIFHIEKIDEALRRHILHLEKLAQHREDIFFI